MHATQIESSNAIFCPVNATTNAGPALPDIINKLLWWLDVDK
jgi:hypothetical protein